MCNSAPLSLLRSHYKMLQKVCPACKHGGSCLAVVIVINGPSCSSFWLNRRCVAVTGRAATDAAKLCRQSGGKQQRPVTWIHVGWSQPLALCSTSTKGRSRLPG